MTRPREDDKANQIAKPNSQGLTEGRSLTSHVPKQFAGSAMCSTGHPDTCLVGTKLAQNVSPRSRKDRMLHRHVPNKPGVCREYLFAAWFADRLENLNNVVCRGSSPSLDMNLSTGLGLQLPLNQKTPPQQFLALQV
ncbi:hypothetical protein J1N35_037664 [Gossypium stocksii]|uniref:Uncharacterized protein n=1 Tax=Gossypium stocksii TaxID=47602 RepID=A0A9D3ZM50_9ROSI|nr:hypothetical protein J1N35_037664 [Gossypium stocksii]